MKSVWLFFIALLACTLCLPSCGIDHKGAEKDQSAAIRDLGEAYMNQGQYTQALREFSKAELLWGEDPYLQNDLGLAYLAKGNPELAVDHFKKALDLSPDYSPARNNLGSAYLDEKNWDAAIKCFKKVSEDLLYATPHYPLTNLGFAYYKKGDYDKAESYYKQALDIKPEFPKALHGMALVELAKGDPAKAISLMEKAVSAVPDAAPIYLDLGRAYQQLHEYNKAYQTFKKAASVAPNAKLRREAEEAADRVLHLH